MPHFMGQLPGSHLLIFQQNAVIEENNFEPEENNFEPLENHLSTLERQQHNSQKSQPIPAYVPAGLDNLWPLKLA